EPRDELLDVLEQRLGAGVEHRAAVGVAAAGPGAVRGVGRAHGAVDRGGVGLRGVPDDLAGAGVRDREPVPADGLDGAVDEDAALAPGESVGAACWRGNLWPA